MDAPRLLTTTQPYRVASHGVAAAYAAWLLEQLGAPVRHETALEPAGAGLFLGANAQRAAEPSLVARAGETLITDAPVNGANRSVIEAAARSNHVIWLTPWGLDPDWAERPATDLTLHAAGGWLSAVGEPDGPPYAPPDAQGQFVAGLFAAVAALGPRVNELAWRPRSGLTVISIAEAVASTLIYDTVAFQYFGRVRARAGHRYSPQQPVITTLRCRDGYVGLQVALHRQWLRLCELIGHPELAHDPRFADPGSRGANADELDPYIETWLADRTRYEAYHALQQAGIPASAHPTIDEVLASPQLVAREAWSQVPGPDGEAVRVPGPPIRVRDEASGEPEPDRTDGPWQPGRLRVLDLSMGWAGPMVGHLLAYLGADVIKVEGPDRFDWWRGSRPPGVDPSLALHERSHVFNSVNRGKRGIAVDLASGTGRELCLELVASADVLIENFSPPVLGKLGLDYDTLSAINPRLIAVRQPGFGLDGPEANYFTFGNTIEGMSGLTHLVGSPDGPPLMLSNALGDPVSGLNGTLAVLAALVAREADGKGRCLEAAQLEGFLPLTSEAIVDYQLTGVLPIRDGNHQQGHEPSGVFPSAGDEQWIAIDVPDDVSWTRLADLLGEPWASDIDLHEASARALHRGHLEATIATWTSSQERDALAARLLDSGVPAAPVNSEADLFSFPPVASHEYFQGCERAVVGYHLYPGLPLLHEDARLAIDRPAPLLGEHTDEVIGRLDLDDTPLALLHESGIIASPG